MYYSNDIHTILTVFSAYICVLLLCSGTCSNNRCYCDVDYEGQYCTTKTTNRGKGTSAAGGSQLHLLRSSSHIAAAATTLLAVLSFV